jgi:hypothetical protein
MFQRAKQSESPAILTNDPTTSPAQIHPYNIATNAAINQKSPRDTPFQLHRQFRNPDRSLEGWRLPVSEGRRLRPKPWYGKN